MSVPFLDLILCFCAWPVMRCYRFLVSFFLACAMVALGVYMVKCGSYLSCTVFCCGSVRGAVYIFLV